MLNIITTGSYQSQFNEGIAYNLNTVYTTSHTGGRILIAGHKVGRETTVSVALNLTKRLLIDQDANQVDRLILSAFHQVLNFTGSTERWIFAAIQKRLGILAFRDF